MKIRTMLIFIVACFSLVSMIVFTVYESGKIGKSAEAQYSAMVLEMAEKQSDNIQIFFNYINNVFSLVARCTDVQNYIKSQNVSENSAEENEKILNTLETYIQHDIIDSFTIFNENNEILAATDTETIKFFDTELFKGLKDDEIVVYTGNDLSNEFKFVSKKQLSSGYYILGIFNNEHVKTIFKRSAFPLNGRIILIDSYNHLLDTTYVGNLALLNMPEYGEFKKQIVEQGFTEGVKEFKYEIGRNARIAYLINISDTGWKLGVIAEADNARKYSNEAAASMVNCLVFLGIALLIIMLIVIIMLTKPLYIIAGTLVKIKRGDHEARINVNTGNEFGEIASAFNDLLDDLIVSESRYRTILEMSDNIIFEWNFQSSSVIFSNNFNKKFSYRAPSDSFEDSFLVKCKVHPDDEARYKIDLENLKQGKTFQQNEYRCKNVYGDYIWILMRTAAIRTPPVTEIKNSERVPGTLKPSVIKCQEGEIIKIVGVIVDIDRAKKSEKILTSRASYDALTELYNRETVESLVNNEIQLISARKNEFAILFVDVDDFKQYNDNYSHATGDQVLKFVASSINEIISEFGIAGRYGGDEFVICIRNSDINDPARTAQDILAKLKEGFVCDVGDRLTVAVSIGIAIIKDSSRRVDEIIGMADDAMYRIKKNGKSNYGFIE